MAVGVCNGSLKDLCEQMKGVKADLLLVRQDLQKTAERTTALEERVSGLEDNVLPITKEIKWLKEQLSKQASKLDEMENRSRRDNVRLIGLPERSEGANPIAFLEKWLGELIGKESFSASFSIIRAHRIPFRAPSEGGHPRPLLLRFLNYQDKVTLLRKIREAGEVFFLKEQKYRFIPTSLRICRGVGQSLPRQNAIYKNLSCPMLFYIRQGCGLRLWGRLCFLTPLLKLRSG